MACSQKLWLVTATSKTSKLAFLNDCLLSYMFRAMKTSSSLANW